MFSKTSNIHKKIFSENLVSENEYSPTHNFVIEKVLFFAMFLFIAVIFSNYMLGDINSAIISACYWVVIIAFWLMNRYKVFNYLFI